MDFNKIAEEIFKFDTNIRFVALVGNADNLLFSRMREGIPSITSAQNDEELVAIFPPLIMRAVERLQRHLGDTQAVSIRYDKLILAIFRVLEMLIVVSVNPVVETPFLTRFGDEIKRIIQRS
jgi:hypothetical protein